MASGEELLARIRASHAGHATDDFQRLLEHYGYEHVRDGRHGPIFRHPELAAHPDQRVRMEHASVQIPRGRDLRAYVARKILASVDVLLKHREEGQ
jgi:hypothetical protein